MLMINLTRVKSYSRQISVMSDNDKNRMRNKWRLEKQKARNIKRTKTTLLQKNIEYKKKCH